MLNRQALPRRICASLARWLKSQSCSRAKARVESTLAKDVCSQRPLKPSHKNCRSPGKHLAHMHTCLIGSMYPFSLVGKAPGPEFPFWGASGETSARFAQISDFRCQVSFSGALLAKPPPDSLRSSIFDDFGIRRLIARFSLLGRPSRDLHQARSDCRFRMISGLGGSWARFPLPGHILPPPSSLLLPSSSPAE